jgi:hypothetical protein
VTSILNAPTEEIFGVNYNAALEIYNGIINGDETVTVALFSDGTMDKYDYYYEVFSENFKKYVLNNSMQLAFSSISWQVKDCDIKLTANTKLMNKKINESVEKFNVYHDANLAAGVKSGITEMEAIIKMLNWMTANLKYDSYVSGSSVEALETGISDYRWYAEIFYYLCKDVGIDCEIVYGLHTYENVSHTSYWNRVKIGETWYYTDMWFYSVTSHANYESLEYFLSEQLWDNHSLTTK